jgi:predicted ester cyclase
VVEGDEVVVRWAATGTHRGAVVDESPTGNDVTVTGFGSWIVRDGKITEHWASSISWDCSTRSA